MESSSRRTDRWEGTLRTSISLASTPVRGRVVARFNTSWELKVVILHEIQYYNETMQECHGVTNVSQVFTSKNKMSSHRSRNCNPNKDRRKTLWESFAVISLWFPSIFQWNTLCLVHFKSYSCPNYSLLPEKVHLLSFIDITFVLIYNFVCLSHSSGIHYNLNKRRSCPCPYIT